MSDVTITTYEGSVATAQVPTVIAVSSFEGRTGATGPAGDPGQDGVDGASAYALAVGAGFSGTLSDWLASLVGAQGDPGADGNDGQDGGDGAAGRGISSVARTSGTGAAGTTDTYTITYSDATTSTFNVVNGSVGTAGAKGDQGDPGVDGVDGADGMIPWFDVTTYGATGDGTTDDTTDINAAIAALNTAGGGTLYFPAGTYKCTSALTTITAHAHIVGDGSGDQQAQNAATTLKITATTGYLMTCAGNGTIIQDLAFENPTSTTQTAGAAIRVTQGDSNRYRNISVRGFYDCMTIEDGAGWTMDECWLVGPVRYGLYIRHIDLTDGGDQAISKTSISAVARNASAAIRYESGGGLKMSGCKINTLFSTGLFTNGLDATITAITGVMTISGNSFENVTGAAIKGALSGGTFQEVAIVGNQFGYYSSGSYSAVDINGWKDVTVVGNTGLAQTSSAAMVKFTSVNGGFVGANTPTGFASEYSSTSTTGVRTIPATAADVSAVPTTRTVSTDSTMTGGGALSSNLSLAVDTTAEAERIRDVIGAALVAGTDIDITVSDAGDTITVTSTASAGGGGSLTVQDENSNVATAVTQIDFQGAGVTATSGTGEVVVTIPSGGGSAWDKNIDLPLSTVTGWTAGAGTWTVASSVIKQTVTSATAQRLHLNTLVPLNNVVAEWEQRVDAASTGQAGLVFGTPLSADGSFGFVAGFTITSTQTTEAYTECDNSVGGGSITLASAISHGTWYKAKVHKSGSWCTYWLDTGSGYVLIGSFVVDAIGLRTMGRLALKTYNAQVSFRNLKAWSPTMPT